MIILEDTRQQTGKHDNKASYFKKNGIEVKRTKLYVGDYTLPTNQSICIDTKQDIGELISDLVDQHDRFRDECIRAQEAGIKLIILVEHDGEYCDYRKTIWNKPVRKLEDLAQWKNPRAFIFRGGKQLYPRATKGVTLLKMCSTMQKKYGVEFQFCESGVCGKRIMEILSESSNAV